MVVQHVYDTDELAKHRAQAPDVKESFEIGREQDDTMPNILLPAGVLPGFNEACLDFFWVGQRPFTYPPVTPLIFPQAMNEVEKTVLRALALGLGLTEDFFVKVHTAPDNQLRLLHYPRSLLHQRATPASIIDNVPVFQPSSSKTTKSFELERTRTSEASLYFSKTTSVD